MDPRLWFLTPGKIFQMVWRQILNLISGVADSASRDEVILDGVFLKPLTNRPPTTNHIPTDHRPTDHRPIRNMRTRNSINFKWISDKKKWDRVINTISRTWVIIQSRFKSRLFGLHVFFAFFKSKILINLRPQFRVRKIFRTQVFVGFAVSSFRV